MNKDIRHNLVVTSVTTTNNKVYFTRQSQIQSLNGVIKSIELFPQEKLPSINGTATLVLADCRKGLITLMNKNEEVLAEVPASKFYAGDYDGRLPEVNLLDVEWERSYISFQAAVGTNGNFVLSVIYTVNN